MTIQSPLGSDTSDLPLTFEPILDAIATALARGSRGVILAGPPGVGKTMVARRVTSMLGLTDHARAWLVAEYLGVGLADASTERDPSRVTVPFHAPHHTISDAAMTGVWQRSHTAACGMQRNVTLRAMEDLRSRGAKLGRCNCDQPRVSRAGEVTLARFGVLMLDELPEFRVSTIEGARMRLDHMGATAPFVVATMNPCPCGWRGYTERQCTCSDASIRHYTERAWKVALALGLDAASDDRIEMPAVSLDTLRRAQPARCKPGAWYRARIAFDRGWRSWCMRDERPDDPDVARGWDAAAQTNERSYVKPMLDEGPGVFEAEAAALGVAS